MRIRNFRKGFELQRMKRYSIFDRHLWVMDTPNATVDSWWFQSTMVTVDNFALAACYIREN